MSARRSIVGVDGSPGSLRALRWALARRDRFGPPRPILAWEYPVWSSASMMVGAGVMPPAQQMQDAADAALDASLAEVDRDLLDGPYAAEGTAASVLLTEAADATLLIVGSRGHGALMNALTHSVGADCAAHTPVAMVIVPDDTDHEPGRERIVVGIDGSANADAALAWALDYAGPDDAVTALGIWGIPAVTGFEQVVLEPEAIAAGTNEVVDQAVHRVCAEAGVDPERVHTELGQGDARRVLRDASKSADLLVLGARGSTGFAHWLFGSVTTSLVHRPDCPTVVVPHED